MNRKQSGQLIKELQSGSSQARQIAETIQRVAPDILLLNEFDYDSEHQAAHLFRSNYLAQSQNNQPAIDYPYLFTASVNTGVPTGLDLNNNGKLDDPADSYGFGNFPGQYGMLVLSKYPIQDDQVRTFQMFLWKDMPGARLPIVPTTGTPYYSQEVTAILRLSSKSHWDVPVDVNGHSVHLLASHPTPPVFDGEEDRNGLRNHDEIRFWADYVSPAKSDYLYDDAGLSGGLDSNARFVVAGDLNADPLDGDSTDSPILMLLNHSAIRSDSTPSSEGGIEQAAAQGGVNLEHQGKPQFDTADFSDKSTGNLRIDYVLPSQNMKIVDSGVFWPTSTADCYALLSSTDHRLVWVDLSFSPWP